MKTRFTRACAVPFVVALVAAAALTACSSSGTSHAEKVTAACDNFCTCIAESGSVTDHGMCVTDCSSNDANGSYIIGNAGTTGALSDACLDCVAKVDCGDLDATCKSACDF